MNIEDNLNDFNSKKDQLSKLMNSWNLIEGSSKSDFVKLSDQVLKKLLAGRGELAVKRVIESELCVAYGLFKADFDAEILTNEIMAWWNEQY